MKQVKFRGTLLINFIGIFLITTIPTILTIYIMLTAYIKDVRVQLADSHNELLLKAQMAIDYQIGSLFSLPDHLLNVEAASNFLVEHGETVSETTKDDLRMTLSGYKAGFEYVSAAVLYSHEHQALIDDEGVILAYYSPKEEQEQFFAYALPWYSEYQFYIHREPFFTADDSAVWICIPLLSSADDPIGLLSFRIDMDLLSQIAQHENDAEEQTDTRRLYIFTEYNRALYQENKGNSTVNPWHDGEYRLLILETATGETRVVEYGDTARMISMSDINDWGWKYALVSNDETEAVTASKSEEILFTTLVIATLTNIIAALLITVFTYRPIKEVLRTIDGSAHREKHIHSWFKTKEVNYIIDHINDSVQNVNRMELELQKRLEQIRSAQTMALQTQINPHFLYNTLDTIRWLSIDESGADSKTAQMVESLAMMYRNTFYSENIIVTIKDELKFLSWYIDIIRIRFRDQIQFTIDVDPTLQGVNCIKLSLQPIVENAIQHGLRKKHYVGHIRISAERDADKVHIFVEDDGCGMAEDAIREKNQELENSVATVEGRIGLSNVNERIKLIYGNDYGVSLQPRSDGKQGLVVRVTFPCG